MLINRDRGSGKCGNTSIGEREAAMRLCKAVPLIFCLLSLAGCEVPGPDSSARARQINPLETMLRMPASIARHEGIAAAILIDTSGSMRRAVVDADGSFKPKIAIARRAAIDCLRQFEEFARSNPDRKVLVGVYEFSSRDLNISCRSVVKIEPPDTARAISAINSMIPSGGTPIGSAMLQAKKDLDITGMSSRHMLVITDGENNLGYGPGDVANAISLLPDEEQAAIYFVAFDIGADRFNAVKDAGGLVLAASNGSDLKQTLDFVLTGKILVEQPFAPSGK
jgi:Mg-chelatase subunit ChlD